MKQEQEARSGRRRDFLKLAGTGALGGAAAAAAAAVAPAEAALEAAPKPGYRETDHVKKVYDLARF
jgi:anaerobic selenocysteine-containing dehydrogenase